MRADAASIVVPFWVTSSRRAIRFATLGILLDEYHQLDYLLRQPLSSIERSAIDSVGIDRLLLVWRIYNILPCKIWLMYGI